jgi:hypothetical protein
MNMTTLRDFISTRESDIKAQIKALRAELSDLKTAKSALDSSSSQVESSGQQSGSVTIKDMVRSILKSDSTGLTATDLIIKIKENFDRDLERTSLSPQLSRMKEDGEVIVQENSWFLAVAADTVVIEEEVTEGELSSSPSNNWSWADDSEVPF